MVIGVTGKICAGKDALVHSLEERGIPALDVDALGHKALDANKSKLIEEFGEKSVKDGVVERKVIAKIVFSDKAKLEALNNITHPWMVERAEEFAHSHEVCIINAALLESMDLVRLCDDILYVFAPLDKRLERACGQRGLTEEDFLSRDKNQKEIGSTLFNSGKRVITIINDSDLDNLYRQIGWYCDILTQRGLLK